jgi:hypothetical protein
LSRVVFLGRLAVCPARLEKLAVRAAKPLRKSQTRQITTSLPQRFAPGRITRKKGKTALLMSRVAFPERLAVCPARLDEREPRRSLRALLL